MSTLYIGGAITTHAEFKGGDDWVAFDERGDALAALAEPFKVFVSRKTINEGDAAFILSNRKLAYRDFYAGESFSHDMSIPADETFVERVKSFIEVLNTHPDVPEAFKNLVWYDVESRYYVFS